MNEIMLAAAMCKSQDLHGQCPQGQWKAVMKQGDQWQSWQTLPVMGLRGAMSKHNIFGESGAL